MLYSSAIIKLLLSHMNTRPFVYNITYSIIDITSLHHILKKSE